MPPKAIFLMLILVAAAAIIIVFNKKTIHVLETENASLQKQLEDAQSDRKAAQARGDAKEVELQKLRIDSATLAHLTEQMKTNAEAAVMPTGFYVGTDHPVFVRYDTPDPLFRAFMRSLMDSNHDVKAKGKAVFEKICAACHQHDGMGKDGIAPPFVGSEWVLAPSGERLVRIVLNGLSGPITVQGREWNLPMPPLRENLDDDAITFALNYIRTELGTNKASALKPELTAAARKEPHPLPESAAELLQVPIESD